MIYVECYADNALISALGIPRQERQHEGNKGNVCNRLKKTSASKGLVDEDPDRVQPSYLEKLHLLSNENEIKVLFDEKSQNYLIVLCPGLEDWILKVVRETGIDIEKYGLPNDANKLHEIINNKLPNFLNLLEDMKKNSRMLKTLRTILRTKA